MEEGKIGLLQVFSAYHPSRTMQELFEDVFVDRVRLSRQSKVLHIYVISRHLIHQQYVQQLQYELYPFAKGTVPGIRVLDIQVKYRLSDRYGLVDIYEEYGESLLYEIKDADPINYLLVKDEAWVVNDNVITIPMPDSDLAKCRFHEIQDYLIQVFQERFDMEIQVGFNFREEDKTALREAHEKRLIQEREQHEKQLEQLRAIERAKHGMDKTAETASIARSPDTRIKPIGPPAEEMAAMVSFIQSYPRAYQRRERLLSGAITTRRLGSVPVE